MTAAARATIVAIDLGGTRLRVALAHAPDAVEVLEVVPTPHADPDALGRLAARAAASVAARAAALEAATGLSTLLGNDADLTALGEHRAGAGCGVGAGVIIGGRLLHGHRSLGEVGQTVIDWRTGDTVE